MEGAIIVGLFDRKMQDPVSGTARVIDNDGLHSIPGQAIHCPLDLMVEADGLPAYMVHVKVRPKTGKWPEVNQVLPVIIDRHDPSRVEIDWDKVPSLQDKIGTATVRRIDAAQHQVAGDGSPADLMRQALADPAAFAERMRSHGVPSQGVPSADPVDQIAKLAELHDRGALTDEEFQAMKARILGL